jgi:hypothetical protein
MYISGVMTGSMVMFLVAVVWTIVLLTRFNDLLWRERGQRAANSGARKIYIEDIHGNRRVAYEVKTIDMADGESVCHEPEI